MRSVNLLLFIVPLVLVGACKKDNGTGSPSTTLSGDCKFAIDAPQCQPGGKAAFCAMSQDRAMKVAWQSFTCPDCAATGKGVKCSAYTAGEPCSMLATPSSQCSKDGKSEFTCSMETHTWKVEPCAGGCKGDMEKGISCSH